MWGRINGRKALTYFLSIYSSYAKCLMTFSLYVIQFNKYFFRPVFMDRILNVCFFFAVLYLVLLNMYYAAVHRLKWFIHVLVPQRQSNVRSKLHVCGMYLILWLYVCVPTSVLGCFPPLHSFFSSTDITCTAHIIKLLFFIFFRENQKAKCHYAQQDGDRVGGQGHKCPRWKMRHTWSPLTCTCICKLCPISVVKLLPSMSTLVKWSLVLNL